MNLIKIELKRNNKNKNSFGDSLDGVFHFLSYFLILIIFFLYIRYNYREIMLSLDFINQYEEILCLLLKFLNIWEEFFTREHF